MPKPFSSFRPGAASSAENLRVRRLQVGFLLLLGITAVQVVWWLVDQARIADRIAAERGARLEVDRTAAEASLLAGRPPDELRDLYPDLLIDAEGARIRPEALLAVEAERGSHLSQYRWEGAFFLLVLGGGILVLWRVLHREADLLNRQQNFLAAVSHELRSPLASLRLTTETLLLRDLAAADRRGLLERNLEDLRRLERLVGNLLETTRLEERGRRRAGNRSTCRKRSGWRSRSWDTARAARKGSISRSRSSPVWASRRIPSGLARCCGT